MLGQQRYKQWERRRGLLVPAAPAGAYDNLANWPSALNRPQYSGGVLSFIAPIAGGPSTNADVAQTVTLTNTSGRTISSAGATIQGENISGPLTVSGDNVTIKRCRIQGGFYGVDSSPPADNCVIEDCLILAGTQTGFRMGPGTIVRRCWIATGFSDGYLCVGDNTLVIDNYADFVNVPGAHHDGYTNDAEGDNSIVRHNVFNMPFTSDTTACITFDTFYGIINDVMIDNNLIIGAIYGIRVYKYPPPGSNQPIHNVTCINNHIRRVGGFYGNIPSGDITGTLIISGNIDADTLANIDSQI